ncbi:Vacuolar fusion protein [Trichinella spiralis]|uniref:Vacuolar fusion protein n=1 Tax=Trichinella spiralis TaxID=6334 RepID=A0ABR3KF07_TRISP
MFRQQRSWTVVKCGMVCNETECFFSRRLPLSALCESLWTLRKTIRKLRILYSLVYCSSAVRLGGRTPQTDEGWLCTGPRWSQGVPPP